MSNRGFDITDEGFYILSYRWWDTNTRTFTGAQFLYGPVFDALGHNIMAMRLFRLLTVLLFTGAFARAFMNWLATRNMRITGAWNAAGTMAILCSGGMIYAWLPQSPGYDDVAALGSLGTAAALIASVRRFEASVRIPFWLPIAAGTLLFAQLLARWTAVVTVGLFLLCVLLTLSSRGLRTSMRYAALTLGGVAAAALFVHVAVYPLNQALPDLWLVNKAAASETISPAARVVAYARESWWVLLPSLALGLPLIALAALARVRKLECRLSRSARRMVVASATCVFGAFAITVRAWQGGHTNTTGYTPGLVALLLVAVVAAGRLPSRRDAGVVILLALLPPCQAFGTSNPLWLVGANAFPAWFALVVWLLAGLADRPLRASVTWVSAGCTLVLVGTITFSGVLLHPYRTTPFAVDTVVAPGLGGVQLSRTEVGQLRALAEGFKAYSDGRPVPILAFDKMPGLIYMLGATAAGEPWTGPNSTERTAVVFKDACDDHDIGSSRPPYLLYNRAPAQSDVKTLAACGFDFPGDFVEIPLPGADPEIRAFAPASTFGR
jgi:hypothetical protein